MTMANPYRQYQATQVQTAGPGQLTLMCYDGMLRFLTQARDAMGAKRYDVQDAHIGKAQALLKELLNGLDFERGGEIAQNLDRVYRYLYDRLTHANIKDDLVALDEVKNRLAELREAWSEALNKAGSAPATPEPTRRDFTLSV